MTPVDLELFAVFARIASEAGWPMALLFLGWQVRGAAHCVPTIRVMHVYEHPPEHDDEEAGS